MLTTDSRHHRALQVDRLTPSLANFAKLVELFDRFGYASTQWAQQFKAVHELGQFPVKARRVFPKR